MFTHPIPDPEKLTLNIQILKDSQLTSIKENLNLQNQNKIPDLVLKSQKIIQKNFSLFKKNVRSLQCNFDLQISKQLPEFLRAKLRLKIYEYCQIRQMSLKTASLACFIFDRYVFQIKELKKQDLNFICLSCIRISNKLQDRVPNQLRSEFMEKALINEKQGQICQKLNFQLNYITQIDLIYTLINSWSNFKLTSQQILQISFQNDKILNYSSIILIEFVEYCLLIPESLKYRFQQLVFNVFYFVFCMQFNANFDKLTLKKIAQYYKKSNTFRQLFVKFQNQLNITTDLFSQSQLKIKLGVYLLPLFKDFIYFFPKSQNVLNNKKQVFNPNNNIFNKPLQHFLTITNIFSCKFKSISKYFEKKQRSFHK